MSILTKKHKSFAVLGALGAAGVYVVGRQAAKKVGNAAGAVGDAINPVNQENIFYRGVNAVGSKIAQDDDFAFGIWVYDKLNGGEK